MKLGIMVEAVVLMNMWIESPQDQVPENLDENDGSDKAYITGLGVCDFSKSSHKNNY